VGGTRTQLVETRLQRLATALRPHKFTSYTMWWSFRTTWQHWVGRFASQGPRGAWWARFPHRFFFLIYN
jgi:hypothetical protein